MAFKPLLLKAKGCNDPPLHRTGGVESNAKGKLGQALVQQYFEYAGWAVTASGLETTVDHLRQLKLKAGDLAHLPDLFVSKVASPGLNSSMHRLGQAFYVEVKTWNEWSEGGSRTDMRAYLPFGHVLLVWVSPDGLKGAWLSRPGDGTEAVVEDPANVVESDFRELARVGVVWMRHCSDGACEKRVRKSFDGVATMLSTMEIPH